MGNDGSNDREALAKAQALRRLKEIAGILNRPLADFFEPTDDAQGAAAEGSPPRQGDGGDEE